MVLTVKLIFRSPLAYRSERRELQGLPSKNDAPTVAHVTKHLWEIYRERSWFANDIKASDLELWTLDGYRIGPENDTGIFVKPNGEAMEVVVTVRRGLKSANKQAKSNRNSKLLQCSACSVEKPVVDFSRRQMMKPTPCCKLCVETHRNAAPSDPNDISTGDDDNTKSHGARKDGAAASEGVSAHQGSLLIATRRKAGGRADAKKAVLEQRLRGSASGGGSGIGAAQSKPAVNVVDAAGFSEHAEDDY